MARIIIQFNLGYNVKTFKTIQEDFWTSEFASGYMQRNNIDDKICNVPSRINFFKEVIDKTHDLQSVIEFGANIGLNILALKKLKPTLSITALEINSNACESLKTIPNINVINESIVDAAPEKVGKYDLTFTSGVLIHINPEELDKSYNLLYECSNKYILVAEYYSPKPVMIPYHGKDNVLFKRDFAGELLDRYNKLKLVDYGFKYHRDNCFPLGDLTWFLLEKQHN